MVRKANIKERIKKVANREVHKIIIVGGEGKYQSERCYLKELGKRYRLRIVFAEGNDTDPEKIVKNTIGKVDEKVKEIKFDKDKELAVSIFDIDLKEEKEEQLAKAKKLAKKNNIEIITSNPCFEVWYLLHFKYSTKPFKSSKEVVDELKKFDKYYKKGKCDFAIYEKEMDKAINNCKELDKHHRGKASERVKEFNNPQTEMYKLVEELIKEASVQ